MLPVDTEPCKTRGFEHEHSKGAVDACSQRTFAAKGMKSLLFVVLCGLTNYLFHNIVGSFRLGSSVGTDDSHHALYFWHLP